MKKVALIVYSCDPKNRMEKINLEKEIRNEILIKGKGGICVEFYNVRDSDHSESKFHSFLKKRSPNSTLFYNCDKETIVKMIRTIEERIAIEVEFFFQNYRPTGVTIERAKEVNDAKEFALHTIAISA